MAKKINGRGFHICTAPDYVIEVGGDRIWFEWTYPGPWPLTKKGDPRVLGERHPFWKHPFWDAVTLWDKQGRKVKDGLCDWKPEPEK